MKLKMYILVSYIYVLFNTYLVFAPSNLNINERITFGIFVVLYTIFSTYYVYKYYTSGKYYNDYRIKLPYKGKKLVNSNIN